MVEQFKAWKGKSINLPGKENRTPGHIYYCTDTHKAYIVNADKEFEIYSTAVQLSYDANSQCLNIDI
jgi:hypothetical protein